MILAEWFSLPRRVQHLEAATLHIATVLGEHGRKLDDIDERLVMINTTLEHIAAILERGTNGQHP